MDFSQFDSVAAAEKGAKMALKHPATGKPMMDGDKPCAVIVRGAESDTAQEAIRVAQKARAADESSAETLADYHEKMVESALSLIIGFENVHRGDNPVTSKDARWFLNLNRLNGQDGEESFAEQVNKFAVKRVNFLGNG